MKYMHSKEEHIPQKGDVILYYKDVGTLSYSTADAKRIAWGTFDNDKILTELIGFFTRKKIGDKDIKTVIESLCTVVARALGLTGCMIVPTGNTNIIRIELF